MNRRDNILRSIRFERPEVIPMQFHVSDACWAHYDQTALQDLMESHTYLFPDFKRKPAMTPDFGPRARKGESFTDPWGCVWECAESGMTGAVSGHPLADWSNLGAFRPPDPALTNGLNDLNWPRIAAEAQRKKAAGQMLYGQLLHGHTFLRLIYLRGYENLLMDMVDEAPDLMRLIDMVEAFNAETVRRWMDIGPDIMRYPEDLGMQVGPMLSPEAFQRYIKPVYQRLMAPARRQGCIIHMHSDGDIRLLIDDLIDDGVQVMNLQDLVNGIDWIAGRLAGKVCVDLDIDRQRITARGTPAQIDALVRDEVEKLGSKLGGLMMMYGMYPGIPLENVKALMDAMERYASYYS